MASLYNSSQSRINTIRIRAWRHEPIDDPTATAAGIRTIPEVRPYVVDGSIFPIEGLPAGVDAAVPEETVERARVLATRKLQQVVGGQVVVLVDGLNDTGEQIAELGVVGQRKAFTQQRRSQWRCGDRMGVERGRGRYWRCDGGWQ